MKTLLDTKTGLFLSRTAYDEWITGSGGCPEWTDDPDLAATFVSDDAPPADDRYRIVEWK